MTNKLRELRKNSALTQKQIADVLGIDRSTYSYYENGKASPSLEVLMRIAKVFNVTLDYIIYGDESGTVQPVSVLSEKYSTYTKV
ncbi:MAG: helix-turn-helix transcriptional regulator, partial [Acutalibacteraceae bacterium]